jgi:hypothetical protein
MHIEHVHKNADSGPALSAHRLRAGPDFQHLTVGRGDSCTFLLGYNPFRIPKKMNNAQGHNQGCQAGQGPFDQGKKKGDQDSHADIGYTFQAQSDCGTPHGSSPLTKVLHIMFHLNFLLLYILVTQLATYGDALRTFRGHVTDHFTLQLESARHFPCRIFLLSSI